MTINSSMARVFRTFTRSESGNVAILFALSALPFFLAAGAAIDFARYTSAEAEVQTALDTAALAAAAAPSKTAAAKRIKIGEDAFYANLKGGVAGDMGITASFKVENGAIVSVAEGEMPTSLMKLASIDSMAINLRAEVNIVATKKAEIVLVLDYSGSMNDPVKGGTKYKLMNAAATKLVNDLKAVDKDKVKVGLVPFSQYVRATLPAAQVVNGKGIEWSGCTQDRGAPYNLTDDEPGADIASKWGQPLNTEHKSYTCAGFNANNLNIVPLTDQFDKVTTQLAAMKPYGYTHIALGLEFGYQLISQSAPYTEGVEFGDKETNKYVVLLTDGSQTENARGPGGVRSVAQGELNTEALCANMKSKGVTLVTMAFDLTDKDPSKAQATKDRLRNCASDPVANYFDANDGADLAKAFDSIRSQVAENIFLNK